jgi:hypothetical protein
MFSALLSFLGGSVFRAIWGEISAWLTKRQDHAHELQRMELQGRLDAEQHSRNLEAIRVQAELGVKEIRTRAEGAVAGAEAEGWRAAVESIGKATGIWLVDLWNGVVRPATATVCLFLWVLHVHRAGWVLDEQGWSILGAALGLYLADRTLMKRGK